MKLEQLVEQHYHELNENDLYIWQYILHHQDQCQKMSIQEFSKKCNVSHTSLLRFAKKLGLDGYSELKFYLKSQKKDESYDFKTINEIYQEYVDIMGNMIQKDFSHILEMIEKADCIYVYGTGSVQRHMAEEIRRQFIYVKKVFHPVGVGDEIDATLSNIRPNDLFLIISFSGDNEVAINLAKALKALHITAIGIAKEGPSLLSKYCEEMITFRSHPYPTGFGVDKYSSTGHFFLISDFLFLRYLEYMQEKRNQQKNI